MPIQRSLDKPEKWADRNITKFKEGKPKVLFLERNTTRQAPEHTGHLDGLEMRLSGKALEVLGAPRSTQAKICTLLAKKDPELD